MKALLIEPPQWNGWPMLRADRCSRPAFYCKPGYAPFPYWLASSAAYLRANKIAVDVLDANAENISWEEVEKRIRKSNPDVIIFTGANCSLSWDLKTATVAKKVNPKMKTAIYEPLLSPQKPQEILDECAELDAIFLSEPENIALSFCQKGLDACGIAYRKKGKLAKNPIEQLDITNLPMPAYDLVPMEKYDAIFIRASRGCPFMCNFCSIGKITDETSGFFYEKKLRFRNSESIGEEMKYLEEHGFKDGIDFMDETFTLIKEKSIAICDSMIKRNVKVKFRIQTRVDRVDEEILQKLKEAGCNYIGYGIESGDEAVLKATRKNITVKQIEDAIKLTKKVGIKAGAYNIIGQMGETKDSIRNTINLNKKIQPDSVQFAIATPMIGTEFWDYCKDNNYMVHDEKVVERAILGTHAHIEYPHLKRQEMYNIVRKGLKEINRAYLANPPRKFGEKLRFYIQRARTAYNISKMPKSEFPGKTSINRI